MSPVASKASAKGSSAPSYMRHHDDACTSQSTTHRAEHPALMPPQSAEKNIKAEYYRSCDKVQKDMYPAENGATAAAKIRERMPLLHVLSVWKCHHRVEQWSLLCDWLQGHEPESAQPLRIPLYGRVLELEMIVAESDVVAQCSITDVTLEVHEARQLQEKMERRSEEHANMSPSKSSLSTHPTEKNKLVRLDIGANRSVLDLKRMIEDKTGIPVAEQLLRVKNLLPHGNKMESQLAMEVHLVATICQPLLTSY